ncbi:MAG: polysaccharide biosynthesis/export family protein [Bacteroidaceae bacterium]|nr:polysaccharide biosynthesis/export family protein [Bacteroidaceae bacterium]
MKKILLSVALTALVLGSCTTPQDVTYFQDLSNESSVTTTKARIITLQPMDQISIIVNSRDGQIAEMFNLAYQTRRLGDSNSLTSGGSSNSNTGVSGYTVDSNGEIDFPILGKIKVTGMTRDALAADIKKRLIASNQIKDPVVTVEFMNLGVTVLGEVARPGRFKIDRDRFTIMDALGLAGDLTINGRRTDVALIRHTADNRDEVYRMDLTQGANLYSSPGFCIQQGDVIYVSPIEKRQREATVNGNNVRSTSFWISIASLAMSILTFLTVNK